MKVDCQESPIVISSESSCSEGESTPDSLRSELMLFRPILPAPRTITSLFNPKILRVRPIRPSSSGSVSTAMQSSPSPSPFSISLTPYRQSAFSIFSPSFHPEKTSTPSPPQPKTKKRKYSKISQEKRKSEDKNPKQLKEEKLITKRSTRKRQKSPIAQKAVKVRKTQNERRISQPTVAHTKGKAQKNNTKRTDRARKTPSSAAANPMRRVTRSMKKGN